MTITKNLVTDYGADPTGVVSIQTALTNLQTDGAGQDVNLTVPAGTYNGGNSFYIWIDGMKNLNATVTGATFNDLATLQTRHIAQAGIDAPGGKNARIQTVNAGATSVALTTTGLPAGGGSAGAGHISRFSVGQWCIVSGWPIQSGFQGAFGFPPNWQFFDYVQITGIVGNTVSFTPALTNYYSSAWPEMNRGTNFETDGGGPATLVGLDSAWGGTTAFTGGTYIRADLINTNREIFQMTGGISSNFPIYPTVSRIYRAINHTATSAAVEHDKLIDTVDIQGGTYRIWNVQSSSTRLLQMTGTTITLDLNGTSRNTVLDTCSIGRGCAIGPTAYGRGETFVAKNTTFTQGITGGLLEKGPTDNISIDLGMRSVMSKTGNVITMPMWLGDRLSRTTMPDALGRNPVLFQGNNGVLGYFRPLSVTSDTWPAADNLSTTVGVTVTNGSKTLAVSSATFSPSDVGKTIYLPGMFASSGRSSCTISNASPGIVTQANHGKSVNDPVRFVADAGVLPSGIAANTTYYVVATNFATNTFSVASTVGGAAINTSGGSGTVSATFPSNIYSQITGYTSSTQVTVFHAFTNYDMTNVSRTLQYGTCNSYFTVDNSDPLPNSTVATTLNLLAPPVRTVRFENCTGNDHVVDLSQTAAWNRPLHSYTKRQYQALPTAASDGYRLSAAGALAGTGSFVPMMGAIQSIVVSVTKAYSGAIPGTLTAGFGQFFLTIFYNGAWTQWSPRFDMKTTGVRTISANGTATGAVGADANLSWGTGPAWIGSGFDPVMSSNISGESASVWPSFTIEMITDQGFAADPIPPDVIVYGGRQNSKWQQGVNNLFKPHFASDDIKKAAAVLSKMGGIARAKALTATQRSTIASTAAKARWTVKR